MRGLTGGELAGSCADSGDVIEMLVSSPGEFVLAGQTIGYERNSYYFTAYHQDYFHTSFTRSRLMDCFGTAISICLQYGVPVKELCQKFQHSRFEPSGFTKNPDIPVAKSIVDYIFRWLNRKFGELEAAPAVVAPDDPAPVVPESEEAPADTKESRLAIRSHEKLIFQTQADAPPCPGCGSMMVRNGACYKCLNCGNSMGCS